MLLGKMGGSTGAPPPPMRKRKGEDKVMGAISVRRRWSLEERPSLSRRHVNSNISRAMDIMLHNVGR
jgi:hypothetical protein